MKSFIIAIIVFSSFAANSQTKQVIAEAGNRKISAEEFKMRFEFVPQLRKNKNESIEKQKEDLLYSIIAEKLWALAAEEKGLDASDIMKKTFKIIEKMYVRDALYEKEIKSKIKIDAEELLKGTERTQQLLYTKYLVSFSREEIIALYKDLQSGADFDSVLAQREESKIQSEYTTFSFGETTEEVENKLYSLKPGEFTEPIQESDGYFIFKLYKKEKKHYDNDKQLKNDLNKVRGIVERRITDRVTRAFYKKFFAGKNVSSDGYVFWSISNALIEILKEQKESANIPEGEKVAIESKDYSKFVSLMGGDTLNMSFISIDDTSIPAEDFVRSLIFEGFYTNTLNNDLVRAKLRSRVKRFIEHELLAAEAYKRGYDKLPEVKMNIDIWRDNYLANLFKSTLLNSVKVTEEETIEAFNKKTGRVKSLKYVNIVEVLTDSLETVNKVLNELSKGKDLRELALKYTKRAWVKENNGEFGFFPVNKYGEIGRIAGTMSLGDIYGPLETPDGYSLFQLISVKEDTLEHKDFDNVKDEFVKKLKAEKIRKEIIEKTVKLANKYGVKINEDALRRLKLKNLEMLVYKYFGFGGRMLAFPITPEFTEWVKPWKENTVLP